MGKKSRANAAIVPQEAFFSGMSTRLSKELWQSLLDTAREIHGGDLPQPTEIDLALTVTFGSNPVGADADQSTLKQIAANGYALSTTGPTSQYHDAGIRLTGAVRIVKPDAAASARREIKEENRHG